MIPTPVPRVMARVVRSVVPAAALLLGASSLRAQSISGVPLRPLPAERPATAAELEARRQRIFDGIGRGVAILVGAPTLTREEAFQQENNFFYLTGVEYSPLAVLVLDGRTRASRLYLRPLAPVQRQWEGRMLEPGPEATRISGIADTRARPQLLADLDSLLATADSVWVAGTPPEIAPASPNDAAGAWAPLRQDSLLNYDHLHARLRERLAARYPRVRLADLAPVLFRARRVKDAQEIAHLRRAGRLAAQGVIEAIRSTAPGRTEQEVANAALMVSMALGADATAFPPILAAGPNVNVIHHVRLGRRIEPADLIVMDYGSRSGGYSSDITRTWPAAGTFDPEQRAIYESLVEARDSMLAAIRPGVRHADLLAIGQRIVQRRGQTAGQWMLNVNYIGHPVGMSVHEPNGGPNTQPWEAGYVYNIEPIVDLPERGWHFRIEDTIVVTETGYENFTADAPVRLDDILRLRGERGVFETLVPLR